MCVRGGGGGPGGGGGTRRPPRGSWLYAHGCMAGPTGPDNAVVKALRRTFAREVIVVVVLVDKFRSTATYNLCTIVLQAQYLPVDSA